MDVEKLLQGLERLDHRERITAVLELGTTLGAQGGDTLMQTLGRGDTQQRRLALHLAWKRRSIDHILRATEDPSLSVRCFAARLVARYADVVPTEILDRLDAVSLGALLRELSRRGRSHQAEALLPGLLSRERLAEAAKLLPACSPGWIDGHLDGAAWPDTLWLRLARYRCDVLVGRIEGLFRGSGQRPDLVWRSFNPAVWTCLARERPREVMAWLDAYADDESLPSEVVAALSWLGREQPRWLVRKLASRVAWVARIGLPRGLVRRLSGVDDAELAPLCRGLARLAPTLLGQLIARLPFPRRGSLFEDAIAPLETARIEWPTSLLGVLPTPLRDREAARMLELARASSDAPWRREVLGFREIGAARAALEREGRSAQALDRAQAHVAMVRSSARSRGGMTETLAWLGRLRNEQDPVRQAILGALAEVPGQLFQDPEALDRVIAPIFDARDTSWATRSAAARIAHRLMMAHATAPSSPMFAYALSVLERLAGHAGTPELPNLAVNLPRGAELAIVQTLLPWIRAAQQRGQARHVFAVWSALGKRAWRVPALSELLVEMVWHGQKNHACWTAELWLQDPKTRDERVRELVSRDRSALYLNGVLQHCHRRRQTLLVERMSDKAPKGRFHDGKVTIIPMITTGLHRWSTVLQRLYLELIAKGEASPKQFSQTRSGLVALRARVPLTRADDLASALRSHEVPVQEAALAALAWLDDPRPALPILLDHLDGDRARVAMYAMPRVARLIPRAAMVEALAELLGRPKLKVTVHKEVIRLLGQLGTERAIVLLRGVWSQPLHRDVRIATLHAARSLLSQHDAWRLLGEAAVDPDEDIARALVETPATNIAQAHRPRYLRTMTAVADHPSPIARAALFQSLTGGWASVEPLACSEVAARVIARLGQHDPWRLAARVLAAGARSSSSHDATAAAVAELLAASERDVLPAGERDRMAYQRLAGVVGELVGERHPTALLLLERLALILLDNPNSWSLGVGLRLAATPNTELGQACLALVAGAPTERQKSVVEHAAQAAAALDVRNWSARDAVAQIEALRAGGGEGVAVALLAAFGPRWGWGAEWTELLAQLRNHVDLDVRLAARGVWISAQ